MEGGRNFPKFCVNLDLDPNFLIPHSGLERESIASNQLEQDAERILAVLTHNFIFSDSRRITDHFMD